MTGWSLVAALAGTGVFTFLVYAFGYLHGLRDNDLDVHNLTTQRDRARAQVQVLLAQQEAYADQVDACLAELSDADADWRMWGREMRDA